MARLPKILDKNILLMALKLNSLTEPANVTVQSFAAGLVIPLIHESVGISFCMAIQRSLKQEKSSFVKTANRRSVESLDLLHDDFWKETLLF